MKKEFLLFVDTETSGKPRHYHAPVSHVGRWPFIVQLAWKIYDLGGKLIKEEDHFIFEQEISIEKASEKIHGIKREELQRKGKERRSVLLLLTRDLKQYRPLIIGHFVEFDLKMLQVALNRESLQNIIPRYRQFCTMRATSDYNNYPNQEYPGLGDLYENLFGEKLLNQHNAAIDVEGTVRCFFELRRRGEFTDELIYNQSAPQRNRKKGNQVGCGLPVLVFVLFILVVNLI